MEKTEKNTEKSMPERPTAEEIYESYGISQDCLKGVREYRNALFRGMAMVLMVFSLLMIIVCAAVTGIVSTVTLLAEIAFSIEAMLLLLEKNAGRINRILARVFFPIPFAMVLTLFGIALVAPESIALQIVLGIFGTLLLATAVFGTVWYFTYNPYRSQAEALKEASADVKELHRLEESDARHEKYQSAQAKKRAQKQRKKAIARLRRQERREVFREEREQLYEFARRQGDRAKTITRHLPGKKKEEEIPSGSLRVVEGSGKLSDAAKTTGRRLIPAEDLSAQAGKIVAELEMEGRIGSAKARPAAGAEMEEFAKK